MASTTNPSTTFTRISHPPLLGILCRNDGKSASTKNGRGETGGERRHAEHRLQSAALHRARQQGPHERPDAGERSQRECQAHQQRSEISAAFGSLVHLREQTRGQGQFKSAKQAESERDEQQPDKTIHPGAVAELNHSRRSDGDFQQCPNTGEKHDNADAKRQGLQYPAFLAPRLAIQEIGDGERDHREDAGGEDGGESRGECR